jgi:hypothetical protein
MAKKAEAEVVPMSRFRRGDPLENVPEIRLGEAPGRDRSARTTSTPTVDLTGKPKAWFLIGNGGVGKTTYARWLIARMVEQGGTTTLAALDPGTRALSAWFGDVAQPDTSETAETERFLADMVEFMQREKAPGILDFGAAGDVSLRSLGRKAGSIHTMLEDAGLGVVACYVMSPRIWDADPLVKMEEAGFKPKATLIVLNEGKVDSATDPQEAFAPILRHSGYRAAVDRGAITLWLPALDPEVMAEIEIKRLHFSQARDGEVPEGATFAPIGGLRRSKVGRWLALVEQAHGPIRSWLP